ncbi:MAG: glycosyltransferase family 4 protein [Candidatus Loosdrechtia sp.]|uniref:glycosyltransferase family 4 protein n=1 Tax=Candidatus Loosdrechtia sp. TaxID=3101272 RepID=UPI003A6AB9A5|nr:MAG: glycosyltransferase family 4 protein [Candidatus Jettenia sp. AMX2]
MFNKLKIMYQQQMQIGSRKKDIFHTIRYSKIDAWLCPLNWLSEQVKKKTRVKPGIVHIVPFGIALEDFREDSITKTEARYKLGIPETALIIGVIGRLDPQKGQHFLIKCIYHLQKNHGDIHLLIVGESTKNEGDIYMNELRNLIKGCNLEEKIHLRPFLERPAIFYKAIDIFALASLSETCGTVIIEAMASGVPIIATNTGGTPELLEQGKLGFLYSPENQEEFLSQISFLLNNAGVAKEKAEKAREKAEKQFSNNYQCEKIEHIITKLLKH